MRLQLDIKLDKHAKKIMLLQLVMVQVMELRDQIRLQLVRFRLIKVRGIKQLRLVAIVVCSLKVHMVLQ